MFRKADQQEDTASKAHSRLSIRLCWEHTPQLSFLLSSPRACSQQPPWTRATCCGGREFTCMNMIHALPDRESCPIIFATLWLLPRALSLAGVHKGICRSPALLPVSPRSCLPHSTISGAICQHGYFSAPKNMD